MLTIACLLKSGGEFKAEHVQRLRDQCQVIPHDRFVCFSDVDVPCEQYVLKHDWPRWWGQLELFRVVFNGPVLYFDLDTTILRDPEIPVQPGEFWSLGWPRRGVMTPTSGVMAWNGDFSHIYHKGSALDMRPTRWVNEGIFRFVEPKIIQDYVPGFYSYKRDVMQHGLQPDTRVVFYHGVPRPWDVPELRAA